MHGPTLRTSGRKKNNNKGTCNRKYRVINLYLFYFSHIKKPKAIFLEELQSKTYQKEKIMKKHATENIMSQIYFNFSHINNLKDISLKGLQSKTYQKYRNSSTLFLNCFNCFNEQLFIVSSLRKTGNNDSN